MSCQYLWHAQVAPSEQHCIYCMQEQINRMEAMLKQIQKSLDQALLVKEEEV
jgi:hypothetical protein